MERISFVDFQKTFGSRVVFSIIDIQKTYPNFDSRRLVEWQKKGYIIKLINKYYIWKNESFSEKRLFFIANRIYSNSYISTFSALRWYGFVPEGVYQILSVSTNKTMNYETDIGNFFYQKIKPTMFFGYYPEKIEDISFLIAEPEKALLDTFYLNTNIKDLADLQGMRLNLKHVKEIINYDKLIKYGQIFNNQRLFSLSKVLIQQLEHAES